MECRNASNFSKEWRCCHFFPSGVAFITSFPSKLLVFEKQLSLHCMTQRTVYIVLSGQWLQSDIPDSVCVLSFYHIFISTPLQQDKQTKREVASLPIPWAGLAVRGVGSLCFFPRQGTLLSCSPMWISIHLERSFRKVFFKQMLHGGWPKEVSLLLREVRGLG